MFTILEDVSAMIGPGTESRREREFPPDLGPTRPPVQ